MNNTSRRNFLKKSAYCAAGISITSNSMFANPFPAKKTDIGIILNTVRNEMKEDYAGTLEKLAALGYTYVEGNSYGGSVKDYGKLLKKLNLKAVAGGSAMGNLQESLDEHIERGHALGYEYICCYWPWLSSAENLTKDECLQTAERLNNLGEKIKKEGMRLAWHNHDKEFRDMGGEMPFDILLQNTDPELVTVEMDLYWVRKGGQNPIESFKKYPGRFELVHVKDMDNTAERNITCVGEGIIDFKEIFEYTALAGIKYRIVEHERSTDGMLCATVSYKHLSQLK